MFAAGVAVSIPPARRTPVLCGAPKTGYLAEEMGRVVAHNVVADLRGEPPIALPPASIHAKYILDAGNTGLLMSGGASPEAHRHAWTIPGPEAHWAKVAFEKYFLATRSHGHV